MRVRRETVEHPFATLKMRMGATHFLMKTLPKAFRKRSTEIQKDLVEARTATEEASARLSSVEERLAKLDSQPKVATEMALHVLAYNLTRVMNIFGIKPFLAAIRA
jgi:transposase